MDTKNASLATPPGTPPGKASQHDASLEDLKRDAELYPSPVPSAASSPTSGAADADGRVTPETAIPLPATLATVPEQPEPVERAASGAGLVHVLPTPAASEASFDTASEMSAQDTLSSFSMAESVDARSDLCSATSSVSPVPSESDAQTLLDDVAPAHRSVEQWKRSLVPETLAPPAKRHCLSITVPVQHHAEVMLERNRALLSRPQEGEDGWEYKVESYQLTKLVPLLHGPFAGFWERRVSSCCEHVNLMFQLRPPQEPALYTERPCGTKWSSECDCACSCPLRSWVPREGEAAASEASDDIEYPTILPDTPKRAKSVSSAASYVSDAGASSRGAARPSSSRSSPSKPVAEKAIKKVKPEPKEKPKKVKDGKTPTSGAGSGRGGSAHRSQRDTSIAACVQGAGLDAEPYERFALTQGGDTFIVSKNYMSTDHAPTLQWPGKSHPVDPAAPFATWLTKEEKKTCATLRLQPIQYLRVKEVLLLAYETNRIVKKSEAQRWCRIDVNKTSRLFDWFCALGWMNNHRVFKRWKQ